MVNSYFTIKSQNLYSANDCLYKNLKSDILIVGGGICGLSTAYYLSNVINPEKIIVIESGRVGFGLTGLSAGLLIDTDVDKDFKNTSIDHYNFIRWGLENIIEVIEKENIHCDLKKMPSMYIGVSDENKKIIKEEFLARKSYGFDDVLLSKQDLLFQYKMIANSAVEHIGAYCFDPVLFCHGMARVLMNRGVKIFENAEAMEYDLNSKAVLSSPCGCTVRYDKLILANYQSCYKLGIGLRNIFLSTVALATHPMLEEIGEKEFCGWLCDGDGFRYTYFRTVGNNQLLVGGADNIVPDRFCFRDNYSKQDFRKDTLKIVCSLSKIFPRFNLSYISYGWRGIVPCSLDGLPFVGEFKKDHYIGVCGNGLINSFSSGKILSDLICCVNIGSDSNIFADMVNLNRRISLKYQPRRLLRYGGFATIANRFFL